MEQEGSRGGTRKREGCSGFHRRGNHAADPVPGGTSLRCGSPSGLGDGAFSQLPVTSSLRRRGLFEDLDKEKLSAGAETMLKIALQLVGKAKGPQDQEVIKGRDDDADDN